MPVFSKTLGNVERLDTESFKALVNHVRVMQEELEYRLAHLDSSNVSEINMDDTNVFSSKGGLIQLLNETDESVAQLSVKSDEISTSVKDLQNDVESSITQTAGKIELAVQESKEYTNGKLENYSTITQTADSIKAAVTESETKTIAGVDAKLEKYSTIEQTASGIATAVSDSKTYTDQKTGAVTESLKNYSTIEQTASKISTAVTESKTYTDVKAEAANAYTDEKAEAANAYTDEKAGAVLTSLERYSTIEQTASSIATAVSESKTYTDQETGKVAKELENYSTIEQTAGKIATAVSESRVYTDTKSEAANAYTDEKLGEANGYTDEKTGAVVASLKNYSTIEQTASSISTAVSESKTYTDQETGKVSKKLENYSTIDQTASKISSAVSESKTYADGKAAASNAYTDGKAAEANAYTDEKTGAVVASLKNYSTIEQTASQISSAVTESKTYTDGKTQEVSSALTQTASSITAQVNGLDGKYTELKTTVDGVTVTDTGGTTRIKGSSIETSTLYVDSAHISGALTASSLVGQSVSLYSGGYQAVGTMTITDTSTGDGLKIATNTNKGGIRVQAANGNVWLKSGFGPQLHIGKTDEDAPVVGIGGGALVLEWNVHFGDSLPANPVDGQVFFLLEG